MNPRHKKSATVPVAVIFAATVLLLTSCEGTTFEQSEDSLVQLRNQAHLDFMQTGRRLVAPMQAGKVMKRLMLDMDLDYVLYDTTDGYFYTWKGGGYESEKGFLFVFAEADSIQNHPCLDKTTSPLPGGWMKCAD